MLVLQSFQKEISGAPFQFSSSQHSNVTNSSFHEAEQTQEIQLLSGTSVFILVPQTTANSAVLYFSLVFSIYQGHTTGFLEQ